MSNDLSEMTTKYKKNNCDDHTNTSKFCNYFKLTRESMEYDDIKDSIKDEDQYSFLYPSNTDCQCSSNPSPKVNVFEASSSTASGT